MSSNEPVPSAPADYEKVLVRSDVRVAEFDEDAPTPLMRVQRMLHSQPTFIPGIVLMLGVLMFSVIVGERFLDPFNLSLIVQQVTIIGILGVAQTIVVLTAGIDLSVGAIMVLTSVVMGKLAVGGGLPAPLAVSAGLIVSMACGWINGVLVTYVRLPPFIVTLGTWSVLFALNLWYS